MFRRSDDDTFDVLMRPLRMPAEPGSLAPVRQALRQWLSALSWPSEQIADVLLAVNEALTNCIEHGRNGSLEIEGGIKLDTTSRVRRVWLTVSDSGRWWPEVARRRAALSLQLMRGCMDSVTVRRSGRGTYVTLLSKAVALPG
jgi:serine/threonine-protein kinase RsbW